MINKNILIGMVLIVGIMIAVVTAQISTTNQNILTSKNITSLKAVEVDCPYNSNDVYNRCFALKGDVNKTLVNINTRVCDRFEYKNVTTMLWRKPIIHIVRTNKCIYRTLSDKEVQSIVDKYIDKSIVDMDKTTTLSNKQKIYPDKDIIGK